MVKAGAGKWRYWITGACVSLIASHTMADSLDTQRDLYQQVRQAWDNRQMATVEQLMPALQSYPLYPYLEYRSLAENLEQATAIGVTRLIKQYPDLSPVRSLSSRFVNELARREDWRGLLAFSPEPPRPVAARCNWYYARWATGEQQVAYRGAKEIWLRGTSLPTACDRLFSVWQASGGQTPVTTLERIGLAMKEGNNSLITYLVKQLPADYGTIAKSIANLQNDPASLEAFARETGPTDFTRQTTLLYFAKAARQDVENARRMIPSLVRLQKMGEQDTQALNEVVAWRLMTRDITTEQVRWRDNVVMHSDSVALLERRIRMSLSNNDRRGLNTWMARLPLEAKQKDEWQYWQADLLSSRGRKAEADEILRTLMQGRGFYPMVAAQRLGVDYPVQADLAARPDARISVGPEIARIRELMFWGMDNLARSEWAGLIAGKPQAEKEMFARYAYEHDWWDLSVQATIAGKLWNHLEERFPLAWQAQFQRFTQDKRIAQSYAMAIARQESAWNPKALSPVGAAGLMQIMPATAAHTVKSYAIADYTGNSQLFEPVMNIQIGTQYLDHVYQQFGENRIFASAAYNAGPNRVTNWQKNSTGQLDVVAFIETIPFTETRGYVKNVLAYDVYYRHFMHQPGKIFSDSEWNQRY